MILETQPIRATESDERSGSNDTNNLGVITGTVLGTCTVILVVIIVLLLVAYTRRKRKIDKNKYVCQLCVYI